MAKKEHEQEMQTIQHRKEELESEIEMAEEKEVIQNKVLADVAGYSTERDFANQLHGQINFISGVRNIFRAAHLKALMEFKNNKLFKHITIQDPDGKVRPCGNFKEYCDFGVRISHSVIYEELKNYDVFGDAIDGMKRMGVERKQLRLLRNSPDDLIEQAQVAAVNNDKDALLEIIDDLSVKHGKEKEVLKKQVVKLQEKEAANERLFADKDKKINKLDRQLRLKETQVEEWPRRTFEISMETTKTAFTVLQGCDQLEEIRDIILNEDFGEEDQDAAIEAMAVVYYDAISQIVEKSTMLMHACNEVFEGYKLGARPLMEMTDLYGAQATQAEAKKR